MFQFGKLLVASIVSTFGTAAIAANAVANNIVSLQVIPSAAIGTAMMTVVGTCRGAGNIADVKKYTKKLMIYSYIAIEVMIVFTLLIGKPVISFYELTEETASLAWVMFFVHSVAAVLVWPLAFTMPNALRAVGDVKYTMTVSMVFVFLFRVGFSWLLAIALNWGVVAIWIAMAIDWVARGLFFTVRFLRGKWQKINVI
jgi:Na+-driven multidrug efflux pump